MALIKTDFVISGTARIMLPGEKARRLNRHIRFTDALVESVALIRPPAVDSEVDALADSIRPDTRVPCGSTVLPFTTTGSSSTPSNVLFSPAVIGAFKRTFNRLPEGRYCESRNGIPAGFSAISPKRADVSL